MSREAIRVDGVSTEVLGTPENRLRVYLPDQDQAVIPQASSEYTDRAQHLQNSALPSPSYSGYMITSEKLSELEAAVDQLPADIRKSRLLSLAGLAGLALTGVAIRYDPRVATTVLEHLERTGVYIAGVSGWGSIGAVFLGLISASDLKEELTEHRTELKNIQWLRDNGRIDLDQQTYFFKWDKRFRRSKPNSSVGK